MSSLRLKIDLSFEQHIEVVKQLSPSEKLKLNDVIWNDSLKIPIVHQQLVLERIEKSNKDSRRMLDWDIVSKTFDINGKV